MNVNFDLSHPGSEIMDDIIVLTTCIVLMNLGIITFRECRKYRMSTLLLYYHFVRLQSTYSSCLGRNELSVWKPLYLPSPT